MPNNSSPHFRPIVRTVRLEHSTSTGGMESIGTSTTNLSSASISTNLTSPTQSEFCPSPRQPHSDTTTSNSRSASITEPSLASQEAQDKPLKKSQSFFSGLLTVKEPSARALADYEKQLMKQRTVKAGRLNAVGLPGVSSATLPPEVPKVNSKWDGVPHPLKEKDKKKSDVVSRRSTLAGSRDASTAWSERSSEKGSLQTSHSRRPVSRGTWGRASVCTTYSSGSRNQLADLYRWEIRDFAGGGSSRNMSMEQSRRGTARQTSTRSVPVLHSNASAAFDVPQPPKIPNIYSDQSSPSTSASPNPPGHPPLSSLSPRDASPATPDGHSPLTSIRSEKSQKTLQESQEARQDELRTTTIEAPATVDEVIIRSSGVNILGPPLSAKRAQRPLPMQEKDEQRPQTPAKNANLHPILKKESSTPQQRAPLGSFPQSPGSPGTRHSARERLGLGLQLRNLEVAPWESPELMNKNGSDRIETPTPESGGHSLRRKRRMSLFRK
ncbi:MAG: hypothetical protein Q9217_001152 [Psora testacea]